MTTIIPFAEVHRDDTAIVGGKAANLAELVRAGQPVPPGFVVTTAAYTAFVQAGGLEAKILAAAQLPDTATPQDFDRAATTIRALFDGASLGRALTMEIRLAYHQLGENLGADRATGLAVAVRSSATAEDLESASFAGQQETFLAVRGINDLSAAILSCWASLWTARALSYRARAGIDPAAVGIAVVIQQMVDATSSGVMFSTNPANGRADQVAISAAWGLGETVVSGTVSTDDLVVAADSGAVLSRHTASKAVMTVYNTTTNGTHEQAVPTELRDRPVLDDRAAGELARVAVAIADHFGTPQDIEWARVGDTLFALQSRPITALPLPTGDTPDSWPVPYPKGLYFRASIVEQLPDPLSPLFADLIDPSVTRSLTALFTDAIGTPVVRAGDVALPTVNGYAYYYYKNSGMLRMLALTPLALRALALGHAHMGITGWRDYSRPRYRELVAQVSTIPLDGLSPAQLLQNVSTLLDAGTRYYTAVQSVIPSASASELLFQLYYNLTVRRPGDPSAATYLLGYTSEPIRADISLWALATWIREHPALAELVATATAAELVDHWRSPTPPEQVDSDLWSQFSGRLDSHLAEFGHAIYNLDFLVPVPAEDPAALLVSLQSYVRGNGTDPAERQRSSAARREEKTASVIGRLGDTRRYVALRLLRWAQRTAPVREDALADVGYAWPLMRRTLHELGQRLVASGAIAEPADVVWLRHTELVEASERVDAVSPVDAAGGSDTEQDEPPRYAAAIEHRRMVWRGQRTATPPQLLPEIAWLGRAFERMMPARSLDQGGSTIRGIGASAGSTTGPARVISGPEEFETMRFGDVLVARMTTPAWTPLFALASAIVTDVGGPLSHSSIVAREYGIPAVLGTGVATQRIASDQLIRVDGDRGTVDREPAPPGLTG